MRSQSCLPNAIQIRSPELFAGLLSLALLIPFESAQAAKFKMLYAFKGGSDGHGPRAGLIMDKDGNLFGTTAGGGKSCHPYGCDPTGNFYGDTSRGASHNGTVFKLAPDGTETVLHIFRGRSDGSLPNAGLIADDAGNLYGTTYRGGGTGCGGHGCGTVYKVAPDGTETVLYALTDADDGKEPYAGLIADKTGNLYGTTLYGGAYDNSECQGDGCGAVFKLAPDGSAQVLHTFTGGSNGDNPDSSLIMDEAGNLYGTTAQGGSSRAGDIVEITVNGTVLELYSFTGGLDGGFPNSGVIADGTGDLFGTTVWGGVSGQGTVFKLTPEGTQSVLYSFTGGNDGSYPYAGLIADEDGNLYGTTLNGGGRGCGTAFELAPDGTETVLHAFKPREGCHPYGSLVMDRNGDLFGTTKNGGVYHRGTVFKISP